MALYIFLCPFFLYEEDAECNLEGSYSRLMWKLELTNQMILYSLTSERELQWKMLGLTSFECHYSGKCWV